jgi:hypothetical protein
MEEDLMKKRLAFGLALASLVISGLTLFSVISRADEIKTLTIISADGSVTAVLKSVAIVYSSLEFEIAPVTLGEKKIDKVFVLFTEPHFARAAEKALLNQSANLTFTYMIVETRLGTLRPNATIENGRIHVFGNAVMVETQTEKETYQSLAQQFYKSHPHGQEEDQSIFASMWADWISLRASMEKSRNWVK